MFSVTNVISTRLSRDPPKSIGEFNLSDSVRRKFKREIARLKTEGYYMQQNVHGTVHSFFLKVNAIRCVIFRTKILYMEKRFEIQTN